MITTNVTSVEECWILTGQRRGGVWMLRRRRYSTGLAASVRFDGPWVLNREETHGDVIGFLHTHPVGPPRPSQRDRRTMAAWTSAFGKPLLCLIAARRAMTGWVFEGQEQFEVSRIVLFDRGRTVVVE